MRLKIMNAGKLEVAISAEYGAGNSALYEGHPIFGATPRDQYSKPISNRSTEDVEVVLNPEGYSGDLDDAERNLIFWWRRHKTCPLLFCFSGVEMIVNFPDFLRFFISFKKEI